MLKNIAIALVTIGSLGALARLIVLRRTKTN